MPEPLEPPKLNYSTPPVEPKPTKRVVGFFGFAVYGLMAVVLWFNTLAVVDVVVGYKIYYLTGVAVVLGVVAAFCTWRAIAAFRELLR